MRVIAGKARGVRLEAPKGMDTRPTADRVREALFSIILSRCDLDGLHVLDICAGTGSMGIEALSRGAAGCCFIERERKALVVLERNIAATRFVTISEILPFEVLKALNFLKKRGMRFDMIFFDPPYASSLYDSVPALIVAASLLADDGLMVLERASRTVGPESYSTLMRADRREYGDTALEFYRFKCSRNMGGI